MSTVAIISDVNANVEALVAVLLDIEISTDASHIIFLGDMVGYCVKPVECVSLLRERAVTCLLGYLDKHLIEGRESEFPSLFLQESLAHARDALKGVGDCWLWLGSHATSISNANFMAAHTDPRGLEYKAIFLEAIRSSQRLRNAVFSSFSRLLFVGCNHSSWVAIEEGPTLLANEINQRFEVLADRKCVVSVGSVGQSRDGDPRACYVIAGNGLIQWRRVSYEVEQTAAKIRDTFQHGQEFAANLVAGRCT